MPESLRDTIARVAREEGIDPAYALAVAERESRFNPNASGTGTIRGLYQMTAKSRRDSGLADDASVEDQTRAFARFTKGVQGEMRGVLGRDPTPDESYLGHHFGGVRAGRTVAGQYNGMAPGDVFSPLEMRGNPHFGKAGSMDELASSIKADMGKRRSRFGGDSKTTPNGVDFAQFGYQDGDPASPERAAPVPGVFDFAQFGQPQRDVSNSSPSQEVGKIDTPVPNNKSGDFAQNLNTRPGREIDLSKYGQPMAPMPQSVQAFAAPGTM